jgi:hypothetical protein
MFLSLYSRRRGYHPYYLLMYPQKTEHCHIAFVCATCIVLQFVCVCLGFTILVETRPLFIQTFIFRLCYIRSDRPVNKTMKCGNVR